MDSTEIVNDIRTAFETFKAANDQRLKEIEQRGEATAETKALVDRANADISRMQANLDAANTRVEDVENRLNRQGLNGSRGGRVSDEQLAVYARWESAIKREEIKPHQVDLDLVQNYGRAFRDWLRHGDRASADSLRIINEMSVGSEPDGGVFVSPDMSGRIATLVYETSPIRQYADVQTITSDALEGINDLDEADASWVGETETRSGNTGTPQGGIWRIPTHEQYAEPKATQKLLDDSGVDIENWLAMKVSDKFARSENTAFVTGNGIHRPRGFTTYSAGTPAGGGAASAWQVVEQVVSGNASALTADGLVDLVFALKTVYRMGAIFGMNRATEREVRQLKDGQNNYLWQPDFQQRAAATLLGFPVVEMPDMPDIAGGAEPIVFGNLRLAYQIVDRFGVRVLRDPYTSKGFVKFYSTKRVGGGVVNFEAIKLQTVST